MSELAKAVAGARQALDFIAQDALVNERGRNLASKGLAELDRLSAERELYPEGHFTFEANMGAEIKDGKVYYPCLVVVKLDRGESIAVLRQIVNVLLPGIAPVEGQHEYFPVQLSFSGTMRRTEDDG